MPAAPALANVPSGGSLALLAYGYRGLVAWRAARGTDWLEAERERHRAAHEARAAVRGAASEPLSGLDLAGLDLVIVSGLPRSGTSMLMQMLAAGGRAPFVDAEREADASNPRGYYEHARVRALARDKGWLPDADGRVTKVVAPLLPLLPVGPRYRVVLLSRSLDEVLRSQRRMLARLGRPAADDAVLRPVYTRHLAAARTWAERTPRVELLELAHADVLADPPDAARRLAAFLGDGLEPSAMAAAVDPTLHRERGS